MNDQDDRETTDTLVPPTDRDREVPTSPEAAKRPAIAPPPVAAVQCALSNEVTGPLSKEIAEHPDSVLLRAMNLVLVVHEENKVRNDDLYNEDGKFAALMGGVLDRRLTAFALKMEPRVASIERELTTARAEASTALKLAQDAINRVQLLEERQARGTGPQAATPA